MQQQQGSTKKKYEKPEAKRFPLRPEEADDDPVEERQKAPDKEDRDRVRGQPQNRRVQHVHRDREQCGCDVQRPVPQQTERQPRRRAPSSERCVLFPLAG